MKRSHSRVLVLLFVAGMSLPSMAETVSVSVPDPVTGDPVSTGVTVKSGRPYLIKANVTIIPQTFKALPVIDPIYVVPSTGGMPLATLDGEPIWNSLSGPPLTPVTQDISLNYVPAKAGSLYLRLLAEPSAITFNSITVDLPPSKPPVVKIKTKKPLAAGKFLLKGTAAGDDPVSRVAVTVNGKTYKAAGTKSWSIRLKLKPGRNKISVAATDRGGLVSKTAKLNVTVK